MNRDQAYWLLQAACVVLNNDRKLDPALLDLKAAVDGILEMPESTADQSLTAGTSAAIELRMDTKVIGTREGTILQLGTQPAFMAVWEALQQFVDNQDEVDDESEWPEDVQAQVEAARTLIVGFEQIIARLAERSTP